MQSGGLVDMNAGGASRPIIACESEYRDGHVVGSHHHNRGQLLYGSAGVVAVTTPDGALVMPPWRGMWIPAGLVHEVRMLGDVRKQNLYFEPGAVATMPDRCQVLEISFLMHSLLAEAMVLPADFDRDDRATALMALILHEMPRLRELPLSLPLPSSEALAAQCRAFLLGPSIRDTIDRWSRSLGVSRRTFTRWFRQETGLSFVEWRQQACLIVALPRLAAGHPVTTIALDLDYDNPAAFTTMFKRVLGSSPSAYFRGDGRTHPASGVRPLGWTG